MKAFISLDDEITRDRRRLIPILQEGRGGEKPLIRVDSKMSTSVLGDEQVR
jgi:hypothetical protein